MVNTHSKLAYVNNHLTFKNTEKTEYLHLSEVDVPLLETTDITITMMLLKRLVGEKILALFCDDKRLPVVRLSPFYSRHDSSLQLTRQLTWPPKKKGQVWTVIISQKVQNQSSLLQKQLFTGRAELIQEPHEGLLESDPANREGHAVRTYFQILFGTKFTCEENNEISAGLDYGYILLLSMFAQGIVKDGCMIQFGLKYVGQFNDFNLAGNFMEPFRPVIDEIAYHYRNCEFPVIKRRLSDLPTNRYSYGKKETFLTNIVSDYTSKIIKVLNNETEGVPQLWI